LDDTQHLYQTHQLAAIAARWDARAAAWDEQLRNPACHLNEDEAYPRFLAEAQEVIQRRGDFCAGQGVIDAGCGTALVLAHVIHAFAWGVGVDISRGMLRVARAKRLPRARFVLGDCFHLPELCAPAGAVLSRGVLLSHYGAKAGEELLAAARASLVPGGFILFDFLNLAAQGRYRHRPRGKAFFSPAEARALARRAGLTRATVLGETHRRVLLLLAEQGAKTEKKC
jgi:SAM-dependent methyltransferase